MFRSHFSRFFSCIMQQQFFLLCFFFLLLQLLLHSRLASLYSDMLYTRLSGAEKKLSLPSLKVRYSRKNIGMLIPLPKKCAAFYPKLCILNFPALDTAVQLESANSKQNAISKSHFQDSFRHIFWAMRKMHHTF